MKTKQDLLNRMAELAACCEATTWVTAQEGTALEIGLRSNRSDWLVWLIGWIDPLAIADFARRCADRAKGYAADRAANANANAARYANDDADSAAYAAAYTADRAANANADADAAAYAAHAAYDAARYAADAAYDAAYAAAAAACANAAAYAAKADADERQAQLTDLRVMWTEITKGV